MTIYPDFLETVTKMRKLGAYDYISKPFYLDNILQKVKKALEGGNKKAGN